MGKFIGRRAKKVDSVYPVVTDETKGGSEEEEDDLYNFESLRSVGKLATEQDLAAALQQVAGIQVDEIALVQRSDKKWRYARLHKKSEDSMSFVLDSAGQTRVYYQQWYSEVRRITKQIGGAAQGSTDGSSDGHFTEFKDKEEVASLKTRVGKGGDEEEVDVYASDDFEDEDDPVVPTDETKGGNGEEHDDLYNFESSRSVGELAMKQDRDPG
jgi:hypothetical protein